jgi:hypothetical protein
MMAIPIRPNTPRIMPAVRAFLLLLIVDESLEEDMICRIDFVYKKRGDPDRQTEGLVSAKERSLCSKVGESNEMEVRNRKVAERQDNVDIERYFRTPSQV